MVVRHSVQLNGKIVSYTTRFDLGESSRKIRAAGIQAENSSPSLESKAPPPLHSADPRPLRRNFQHRLHFADLVSRNNICAPVEGRAVVL